jgi:murein DD-endopeptidase MepM/ murein hydrolase activator NlpD
VRPETLGKILFVLLSFYFSQSPVEAYWEKIQPYNNFLTGVETTPWGILVGEFDTRTWLNPPPLNDIYLSKDLGLTWIPLGLAGRAVTDIKFFDGKIYATTYYVRNNKNGLFITDDLGKTWKQTGPMFSPTKVNRDSETIYLGGQNHGLWISQDDGVTWVQKIGDGQFGPYIKAIESFENITFVTTTDKTYKTTDKGATWEEIPFFGNKSIEQICVENNIIFAGSSGIPGLFKSADNGLTWTKVQSFGNYGVGDLLRYGNKIYAGRVNPSFSDLYTVYESADLGNTWTDTGLNVPSSKRVLDIAWAFSEPVNLYAVSLNNGLYKYSIPPWEPAVFAFLDIPWKKKTVSELIDKITSFFDHEYPLLGYGYQKEPVYADNTTLNFYGERREEPEIYYSSHNGTDYALPYGGEVLAAADGIASYYSCEGCGNSIKIQHPNGYQSIYMHLQKIGLVTAGENIPVSAGDTIGKIGMTGNTDGPHLHFEVLKNGLFPDGLVDPYGWLNSKSQDPWPLFSWQDLLGQHNGSTSNYLWKSGSLGITNFITGKNNISLENKSVIWSGSSVPSQTVYLKNYFQPSLPKLQKGLGYVPNTSIEINAYDFLGEEIVAFSNPVEIKIDFSDSDPVGIIKETIKMYFWDIISKLWQPLPTILDLTVDIATATTYHFSNFVLLGEKINLVPPLTQINISGQKNGNWFTEYPLVELTTLNSDSPPSTIFFTSGGETGWEEYLGPITVSLDGIVNFQFRSMDTYGNVEKTQSYILQIDTKNKGKKTVKVKNAGFTIAE